MLLRNAGHDLSDDSLKSFECSHYMQCLTLVDCGEPCGSCPRRNIAERLTEIRRAERTRCKHRSLEPVRQEPCACPIMELLPIYRCALGVDCADLRTPQSPAVFCGTCKHREGIS